MGFNWFKKKSKVEVEQALQAPIDEKAAVSTEAMAEPGGQAPQEEEELAAVPVKDGSSAVAEAQPEDPQGDVRKKGFLQRLKNGLAKTRRILTTDIDKLFSTGRTVDEEVLEELEEKLITADLGVEISMELIAKISKRKLGQTATADELKEILKQEILGLFPEASMVPSGGAFSKPHVVMVVGVNGVGKTTTIGKIASALRSKGKKVLIAAADTFRAAAVEQLDIWASRAGADIVRHKANSDPAAVAFDGVDAAVARGVDVVLIDTAGRLHTKVNLMEELKKIQKAVSKRIPDAPHETLLVLDATTGQNALSQARLFHQAVGVSSIALTKLDGTAKGGIVVGIARGMNIPIRYIGVGEQIDDLQPFDARSFVDALF